MTKKQAKNNKRAAKNDKKNKPGMTLKGIKQPVILNLIQEIYTLKDN